MQNDQKYYLLQNGRSTGPHSFKHLREMWAGGVIAQNASIRKTSSDSWVPISKLSSMLKSHSMVLGTNIICPNINCGYQGPARKKARGSILVGLILCLFFLLPGIIYFIIKSGYRHFCPKCGLQIANDN
jgi:predicted RNA-binding Zn-ribbon protein involved in translation (DUF1610 family)